MSAFVDLRSLAKLKRQKMTPAALKSSRMARPKTWLYPHAVEKHYVKSLLDLIDRLAKAAENEILRQMNRWQLQAGTRADGWPEEVAALSGVLETVMADFITGGGTTESAVGKLISNVGYETYLFNRSQWGKTTAAITGFEYETPEAWWSDASKAWAQENFGLIKNASSQFIGNVNELTLRAVRTGMTPEQLKEEIAALTKKYAGRAALIAVDQIGKLNGQLTKQRQVEGGIDVYVWQTARDERVRGRPGGTSPNAIPSHWEMEGMYCKWSDSSVYADPDVDVVRDEKRGEIISINWKPRNALMPLSIPGEAIRCRCTAAPVWESFLSPIDQEIVQERITPLAAPKAPASPIVPLEFPDSARQFAEYVDKKYPKLLTDPYVEAAKIYSGSSYEAINRALLSGKPLSRTKKEIVEKIAKFIDNNKLKEPLKLYRGMTLKGKRPAVGATIDFANFASFSTKPGVAANFAGVGTTSYILEFVAPAGSRFTPLVTVSHFANESEVLGAMGQSFRVKEVVKNAVTGRTHLILELV